MDDKKIIDLNDEQRKKRMKRGWTDKELKESVLKDIQEFEKTDRIEPDNLASGDPSKIYNEDKDDEKK